MVIAPLSLRKDYWQDFDVSDNDIEFLYNHLLEVEQPQTTQELVKALVGERIRLEKQALEKQQKSGGSVYYPKEHYQVGQELQFPAFEWKTGKVAQVRPGSNPELPPFEVIVVEMEDGEQRTFAAGLEQHALNQPVAVNDKDPQLQVAYVLETYGEQLEAILGEVLAENDDLVRIAWRWFPRALLVDINIGHLNLAEAVLDMMGGGPLPTPALMEQIDLPSDASANLNEFSLNLALQEDKRFDEVGPAGEILWYLHRLEPEPVREIPMYLRFNAPQNYDPEDVTDYLKDFDPRIIDELEPVLNPAPGAKIDKVELSLIYPHWRAGTLPLAGKLEKLFPTAYEAPRIQVTLVDGNSGQKFSGWVVRPFHYVYGLREWYESQGILPGSLIHVERSKNPGEVVIRAEKKRPTRDWMRTAVIGSDGGIVFSTLRQNVASVVDERMGVFVSDVNALDALWERGGRGPLEKTVKTTMQEMAKLSPQNHVHAQELYAGVNILRRCPPGPILAILLESPWAKHLGNLYFRLDETSGGDTV